MIPGWANLDLAGPAPVIEWDLTLALPLPPASCDFIYSEHFVEHIAHDDARYLLRECHRVLRPGGVLRLTTPSLEKLVHEYRSGQLTEWRDVQWLPDSPCQLLNQGMRLWGHQFVYDWPEILSTLQGCGFATVERVNWRESRHAELRGLECRPYHEELLLEATP